MGTARRGAAARGAAALRRSAARPRSADEHARDPPARARSGRRTDPSAAPAQHPGLRADRSRACLARGDRRARTLGRRGGLAVARNRDALQQLFRSYFAALSLAGSLISIESDLINTA